ncbi:MAG TPA: vitamin K epoxide reductase family protein [Acidimicrobiales bacterium]|nr:vitamin K epoxide reductase family protein [Acidimicrobiales bacterium]
MVEDSDPAVEAAGPGAGGLTVGEVQETDRAEEDGEEDAWDEGDWEVRSIPTWWPVTAFVLSILGLADASYLTYEHFTQGLPSCPATGIINCAKVTTSAQSHLFGIPVALLGLLFFAAMAVINFPPLWRTRQAWVAWLRLAMVVTGLGMVVYLVSAEVFSIKAICLWCTGVHVVTVALFVLVLATFPTVLAAARARAWAERGDDEAGN